MPRFCMPFNGDRRLVDTIVADYRAHVPSFYGSLFHDGLGGGRVLDHEHPQTIDDLAPIVKTLASHGIEFNYVASSTHAMNREFDPEYQRSYLGFISAIRGIGVSIVTLANITLIELTRHHFPNLRVSASVNLRTRTPQDVSYLLDLGCDEITIHYDIFKNAAALKDIRSLTSIDLKLIPNDVFIMSCPWHKPHTRMQAAHTRDKNLNTPYFNYYRNKCVNLRHHKPDEVFKAMWIAPSSLAAYERLGYDYFKLLDRHATTDWNLRVLDAYLQGADTSLELILGTYGARITTTVPEPCLPADNPYPTKHLEVIPGIRTTSPQSTSAIKYFLDPKHPQECGACSICGQATQADVMFSPQHRDLAILNNRTWQSSITKPEFINSLENYTRGAGYQ